MTLGPNQEYWISTLESGVHDQEKGTLFSVHTGGMCCLGVWCVERHAEEAEQFSPHHVWTWGDLCSTLPQSYAEELGLHGTQGEPRPEFKDKFQALADMNDNGSTHAQIAAHLRAHPEVYFVRSA